jgi:hypothetical protein
MVKSAKSVCLVGVALSSLTIGCGDAQQRHEPGTDSSTEPEEIAVTRIVPGANGEPTVDREVSVSRSEVLRAFSAREAYERDLRAGVTADTISVKSGVVNCYATGQPAGWSCFPCEWTDIWIYDQENLTGNRMLCLKPFTDPEGGMWATEYHLSVGIPQCDSIEGRGWDRCAQSAWGPVNATTHLYCEATAGGASWQTNLAPNGSSADLNCTPPNSHQLDAKTTWIWWTQN